MFMLSCSRCHTTHGINSVVDVFERMYGVGKPLDEASMEGYIPNMHLGRTYMPPFPGNEDELKALTAYIRHLQLSGETIGGAQVDGITVNPHHNVEAAEELITKEEKEKAAQEELTYKTQH